MAYTKFEKAEWLRVSKTNPCAICDKPDWCCYTDTGVSLCMRIPSTKPSKGKSGGWLHNTGETTRIVYVPVKSNNRPFEQAPNFSDLWGKISTSLTPKSIDVFSEKMGLDPLMLSMVGCAWSFSDNAWAFPMRNARGIPIGIRLRNEIGQKYAVKGSKSGLFIPSEVFLDPKEPIFICEGPTDTAAALCLGLKSIGRPSCQGLEEMICEYISNTGFKRAVILSDNDDPGLMGAEKLQDALKVPSCVLTMPCKDVREFYCYGGTKKIMESMLKNLIWTKK